MSFAVQRYCKRRKNWSGETGNEANIPPQLHMMHYWCGGAINLTLIMA